MYALSQVGSSGLNPVERSVINPGLCLNIHRTLPKIAAGEQNPEDPAVKPEDRACRKKRYQRERQKLDYDRYKHFCTDIAHMRAPSCSLVDANL